MSVYVRGDGVQHLSAYVEISGQPSRFLSPPATVSVIVGDDTSEVFSAFLEKYAAVHRRTRSAERLCGFDDGEEEWHAGRCIRALIYRCGDTACGGYTDRMKGLLSVFLLALFSGRTFFIEFARPRRLDDLLEPNQIDWRPDGVDSIRNRMYYEVLDPSGAHRVPSKVLPLILDRSIPVVALNHNLFLFASLSKLPAFYNFAWEAGMLGDFPTPTARSYAFLFKHSQTFQDFFDSQLKRLPYPPPVISLLAAPPRPAKAARRIQFDPSSPGSDGALVVLQLRGGRSDWYEPRVIHFEHEVKGALQCVSHLAMQLGVDPSQTFVLVVTPTPRLYEWAVAFAATAGLNASRVAGVRPPVLAHLDRSGKAEAAEAMNYVVLETELMSRASALIVSSGFGETAADFGGVPPSKVVNLKWDALHERPIACTPHLPEIWF